MADLKLSDLLGATDLDADTFFYAVQGGISKKVNANVLFENIIDPVFKGAITFGDVQLIRGTDVDTDIDVEKSRTEFDVGGLTLEPQLPNAEDGVVKVLTLANVQGGRVNITTAKSNIYPNVELYLKKQGESVMLMYTTNTYTNGWVILGSTPGLDTNIELDEANVSDERIRRAISAGDVTINYDQANGKIFVGDISNLVTKLSISDIDTDDIPEGSFNLYFSAEAVQQQIDTSLAVVTKPPANVIYVAKNGDDVKDGYTPANAIANIHVALARVAANANTFWTVQVFPGDYTLYNNPVTIPARCSMIGNDLRTTTVRPENPTSDMFYMNTGAYVFGFTFRGHRAPSAATVKTGSAVFSYNPDGSAGNITTSPYIQNCSSITTTGTGVRVNGDYVGGLRSMVLDAFTQFNEGGIGIHLLNQGYMQLVSLFTICCEYSVLCEAGGFGSITNSNSSFGRYGLVADGVSPTNYSGKVNTQINSRTVQMRDMPHIPFINDKVLMANYNQAKCYRDTGLIVDSFAFDLAYGSNTQSRFSGVQYWGQGLNRLLDQRLEVINAFRYAESLMSNVVINSNAWDIDGNVPYQTANVQVFNAPAPGSNTFVESLSNIFIDIYTNGVFGVTDKIIPNVYPASTNVSRNRTANLLQSNKAFIQAEVSAFFANNYPYAAYLPDRTIAGDIGKLVDNITFDIRHTGNRQTVQQAILFFDYLNDRTRIENQIPQTSAAFEFIKDIIDDILLREPLANTYQTAVTQDLSVSGNVTTSEITYVRNRLDDIINIINNGPEFQNVEYNIDRIGQTASTNPNVIAATNIIFANKSFIQAEVLEYVNQRWMDISNGTRNFYTVNEFTEPSPGVYNVVFDEKILFVDRPLANTRVSFHQGSYLSASSHTFEYVGSGTQLNAGVNVLGEVSAKPSCLPYNGGIPLQELEVVESRGGGIYYTSTDHKGDFRIGNELLINRATGTINGRTFNKSLFAVMTPYILALQ
jgi:hypothetical protein